MPIKKKKKIDPKLMRALLEKEAVRNELERKIEDLELISKKAETVHKRTEAILSRQINNLEQENKDLDQLNHNLIQVISGLGEILGENKSEIHNLKLSRLNEDQNP